MQAKQWIITAGISLLLAVALGAFGAHALEASLTAKGLTAVWETSSRYHFYHSFALLAIAWLQDRLPAAKLQWPGLFFLLGIIFFSGSLYVMGLTGVKVLGAITPVGGVLFMLGWGLMIVQVAKHWSKKA